MSTIGRHLILEKENMIKVDFALPVSVKQKESLEGRKKKAAGKRLEISKR